eukprot:Em0003g860a
MLVALNNEVLTSLNHEELVQKIRNAPALSCFTFVEESEATQTAQTEQQATSDTKKRTRTNVMDEAPFIVEEQLIQGNDFKGPSMEHELAQESCLKGGQNWHLEIQQPICTNDACADEMQSNDVQKGNLSYDILTVGSFAIVSYTNPPIFGTIRWIGTIIGISGLMAGLELEDAMPGCTDGVALHNMVRYFKCPPSRAYFCLLSCLVDEQSFLLERMGGSRGNLPQGSMANQRETKENAAEQDQINSGLQNGLKQTQNCIAILHTHMRKLLSSKDTLKAQYESEIEQLQSQLNELSEKLQFEQQLSKDVQSEILILYQQRKETEGLQERFVAEQLNGEKLKQEITSLRAFQSDLIQQHNSEQDLIKQELQSLQDALNVECKRGDYLNNQLHSVLKDKEQVDKHYKDVVDALRQEKEAICDAYDKELGKMQEVLNQLDQYKVLVDALEKEKVKMTDVHFKELEEIKQKLEQQNQYKGLVVNLTQENEAICAAHYKEIEKMQQALDQLTQYKDLVVELESDEKMSDAHYKELEQIGLNMEQQNQSKDVVMTLEVMHNVHYKGLVKMQEEVEILNQCKDLVNTLRQEEEIVSDAHYKELEQIGLNMEQQNHVVMTLTQQNEVMHDVHYKGLLIMQEEVEKLNQCKDLVNTLRQEEEEMSDAHYKNPEEDLIASEQEEKLSDAHYKELEEIGQKLEQQSDCSNLSETLKQENEVEHYVQSKEQDKMQQQLEEQNQCKDVECSLEQGKENMSDDKEVVDKQRLDQQNQYKELIETLRQENKALSDAQYKQLEKMRQELEQMSKYKDTVNTLRQEKDKMSDAHYKELEEMRKKLEQQNQYKELVEKLREEKEAMRDVHCKELDRMQQKLEQLSQYKNLTHEMREEEEMYKKLELLQENEQHLNTAELVAPCTVPHTEVKLLQRSYGEGSWGGIREAIFRGQRVAVQCLHKAIITQNFYRELSTKAQVCHPNLVTFIAAVLDDQGGPMIITELLDMTLRKAYKDNILGQDMSQCISIFQDIALALRHLHELAEPIIHREVTSSNVLLEAKPHGLWRAKLSNFGCSNWVKHSVAVADGSVVYVAPEAYPTNPSQPQKEQTSKIDVYSYGILLCEVTIREIPEFNSIAKAHESMKMRSIPLYDLMMKCTQYEPELRPTMASVMQDLNAISQLD